MTERASFGARVLARAALGVLWLATRLPLPIPALVGRALGRGLYGLASGRRRVVLTNLALCFPEIDPGRRRRLARAHFAALGQGLIDTAIAWWASPARLRRLVAFRGREYYERALQEGRVILLVPHFTALNIGVALSLERPMANVYRELPNPVFEATFRRAIRRFGAITVTQDEGVRPVLKALKDGRVLYYLPDQDFGERSSVFAPFFGVPAVTLHAVGRLARASHAQVVPCYVYQRPWGRGYEVVFAPALTDFPSGDVAHDATLTNHAIEEGVRRHPEQYFWVHKRFKTRPPGEPSVYSR